MHSLLNSPRDTSAWIISGADSFRLASRKLLSDKRKDVEGRNYGGNRANIEKMMRQIWRADLGYLLAQIDQSGAEALIVAYLCRNAKYRSLFINGIKPHTYLGLKLFKEIWKAHFDCIDELCSLNVIDLKNHPKWNVVSEMIKDSDNWKPNERYYHFAKKTIHAGSYGMRENTFILQMLKESGGVINLTSLEGAKFLNGFHEEFPEIQEWHQRVFIQAKCKKLLRNLFGFPFNITDAVFQHDFKDLIAWIPQSTVACITRQAYIRLQNYIETENKDWHLLNDNHDSYMCEAKGTLGDIIISGEILECARKMQEFMQVKLVSPFDGTEFSMKSEASIGENWSPFKKETNNRGLRPVKL